MDKSQQGHATNQEVLEATASFRAAIKVREPQLAISLLNGPVNVQYLDPDGTSLLMAAAYRGYVDVCSRLIELGADASYGFEGPAGEDEDGIACQGQWETVVSRAKAGRDQNTIDFCERAYVRAHWSRLKGIKESDRGWFEYAGAGFLKDAAKLGLMDVCIEMALAGVCLDPDDPFAEHGAIDLAAGNGHIRTSVLLVALGASVEPLLVDCDAIPGEVLDALRLISEYLAKVEPDLPRREHA